MCYVNLLFESKIRGEGLNTHRISSGRDMMCDL